MQDFFFMHNLFIYLFICMCSKWSHDLSLSLFEYIMRPTILMYFLKIKSQVKGQHNKI